MTTYCDIAPGHPVHGLYHDHEYGFPLADEAALFERLSLEIFQAGLSWLLVLRKRPAIARAFRGFDADRIARFGERDVRRLIADPTIIRNRRKIEAVVENARRIRGLRQRHGGFAAWIAAHHPATRDDWLSHFREAFVFMGPEVVAEFLMSIGYLPGAHRESCPVFRRIVALGAPFLEHHPPARGPAGGGRRPRAKPRPSK